MCVCAVVVGPLRIIFSVLFTSCSLRVDLRTYVNLCERAAKSKETRYLARVLRKIGVVRKAIDASTLSTTINTFLPTATAAPLLEAIAKAKVRGPSTWISISIIMMTHAREIDRSIDQSFEHHPDLGPSN